MIEKEVGYRGSKSVVVRLVLFILTSDCFTVKEQRVDGSCTNLNSSGLVLRCILMGFKRNYQLKNLSNQLIHLYY